ncbi:capsular polysaccharide glycosyltransferase biosynthesis protein [Primorskyibacter flagellatus]|uniref:Capsular polysaccharide glycosyltransferase biosynthesis protein n=1 Tax=Primorskyibacter flagellatus TaxID=1387277 RepID=A0A917ADR7_9RHOB|nr:glycosyltransferase family 1 protein [Primorskyibacter flagellatus]GGE44636.1 capsular polysaccharide glycosyltransferase biosynthesis protein [Primorskyibacter flagellatus]
MPGGGIRLATTTNKPEPVRLLDLTRLISRPGRQPTGIDRVEYAYLRELLDRDVPLMGLLRVAVGYVLLDRGGLTSLLHRVQGRTPWGPTRLLFRCALRLTPMQRQVQSDVWRLASAKVYGKKLDRLLADLPPNTIYLNVGHSDMTDTTLSAVSDLPNARITVMIHDTIPLDFPDYNRPEAVERFAGMLRRTLNFADTILCPSMKTRDDILRHIDRMKEEEALPGDLTPPRIVVAHLGTDVARPDAIALPADLPANRPLFLMVGTIEPRKNHALMLDVWEEWDEETDGPRPVLGIVGSRGWRNEDLFRRLDASPMRNRDIFEWSDLSDKAVTALMVRADALLFPSFAEGYGLPPIEAASLQTPVISSDLPSVREMLGELPVYLPPDDRYPWTTAIKSRIEEKRSGTTGTGGYTAPTWDEHFKVVLRIT